MMKLFISKFALASTLVVISPICHSSFIEYSVSSLSAIEITGELPYNYEMNSVAIGVDLSAQYNGGIKFERRREYAGKNNAVSELSTNLSLVKFYKSRASWNVEFGVSRLAIELAGETKPIVYLGVLGTVGVGLPIENSVFVPNMRVRFGSYVSTQEKERLENVLYRAGVAFVLDNSFLGILVNVGFQRLNTVRSLGDNDNVRDGVFTSVSVHF